MKHATFILLLLFACLPLQIANAKGWQLGGGGQYVEFGDDLEDVDGGYGLIFSAAYHQSRYLGFDFQVGLSGHQEDIEGGDVGYIYNMAGLQLLMAEGDVVPYLAAGISFHGVGFEEFDTISGEGLYYGIGVDIGVAPRHSINISYRVSNWNGEDDDFDYDVENGYLGVAYNFRFTPQ